MNSRPGPLRQLHFWENANRLVEQAYWSGTGAFVMSVENLTVDASGNALPSPQGSIRLDYDPACCILPISVERGVVTEAAFVSECMMGGKPAVYLQTHTVRNGKRTITNEWFEVTDDISGTPKFSKLTEDKTLPGTVKSITVTGAPAWFSLFSPAAVKNLDGGMGLGMSIFSEALDAAQMVDYAFDNYRQDIRLGGKKIFYDRSCAASGWTRKAPSTPCLRMPSTGRSSTSCPRRKAASTSPLHGVSITPTCAPLPTIRRCRTRWT